MHTDISRYVFTEIIDAYIHEFGGIQGAAAFFRCFGSMGTKSVECVVLNVLCLPDIVADTVAVEWMPGNSNIEVIKDSLIVHHDLAGHDLFGRAAIDADRSGCTGCVHIGF